MRITLREPINALTHLAGAALSFIGLLFLLVQRITIAAGAMDIIGSIVFGISMVLLYLSSGIYHGYTGSEKGIRLLKKLDHSMIYVLIAGSYTPVLLNVLEGTQRVVLLGVIWTIALVGILTKIFINGIPRIVYTMGYIVMGWIIMLFIGPIYRSVPSYGFLLLAGGGLLYTIGGIIYMVKRPNISKTFGFHELFHLFILGGSFLHYLFIYFYMF